jgi:dihydroorotate dehydrogenase electron transfer subunit
MRKIQDKYKIVMNEKVCPKFCRLTLDAKPITKDVGAGQFVHIRITDGLSPFFRRPFSVFRAKRHLEILYQPVGIGTKILSQKKTGECLDVLGPLGNPFSLPPKGIKQVVMIAGGVGVAPFLILTDQLRDKSQELILLYGGRTKEFVFNLSDFKKNGCRVYVSTDDGSLGIKGRVSALFSKINPNPKTTFLYTCGPKPMMKSVQDFANQHGLQGQASCEEVMACGLGACLGCVIKTTGGYKTVCNDGPVFDLKEIIF